MLISMEVKNFKSFDQLTKFNMVASNRITNSREERKVLLNDVNLLKGTVLYGANASGKSNFVKVFSFAKNCVNKNFELGESSRFFFCKKNESNRDEISSFQFTFYKDHTIYIYGFDALLFKSKIIGEWIYKFDEKNQPVMLFTRENGMIQINEDVVKPTQNEKLRLEIYEEDIQSNQDNKLFVSLVNRNIHLSKDSNLYFFKTIYEWFMDDLHIIFPDEPISSLINYYKPDSLEKISKIINSFDTGIEAITIKHISYKEFKESLPEKALSEILTEIETGKKDEISNISLRFKDDFYNINYQNENIDIETLTFKHRGSVFEFDYIEESDGTKRIFDLIDILFAKNDNSVYIIDEMERSLHPVLTKRFIELINDYSSNKVIQTILSTHENYIMDQSLFDRDQVWFIDKNEENTSVMYPLDQFKQRKDKKINKAYLEGRYGAIPNIIEFNMEDL